MPMRGSRRSRRKSLAEPAAGGPASPRVPARLATLALALAAGFSAAPRTAQADPLVSYEVIGDAIPKSLTGGTGDSARGRTIIVDRQKGFCLMCHSGRFPEQRFQGDLAPGLDGVGARLSAGQLRLRIVDPGRLNPGTIMPSYYRTDGLVRVARAFSGKPLLSAAEIEDAVAYLSTMTKEPGP